MGQPGDLLLVFADRADALLEADHQVPAGGSPEPQRRAAPRARRRSITEPAHEEPALASLEGLIRDERGIRFAPEAED